MTAAFLWATPKLKVSTNRVNSNGDRHLNNALHTVVQSRIQYQPATRDYIARRTTEGKTSREKTLPCPLRRPRPLPATRK